MLTYLMIGVVLQIMVIYINMRIFDLNFNDFEKSDWIEFMVYVCLNIALWPLALAIDIVTYIYLFKSLK